MVDFSGTNWRRIGSSSGLDQSATLRICGVKRIDMGATFMPATTSKRKSSQVFRCCRRSVGSLGSGSIEGSTLSKKRRSLSCRSIVFAVCTSVTWCTSWTFARSTYLPMIAHEPLLFNVSEWLDSLPVLRPGRPFCSVCAFAVNIIGLMDSFMLWRNRRNKGRAVNC